MSYISTDLSNPRFGHAWRDDSGGIYATVRLTGGTVAFDSTEGARAVAAACEAAAQALEKLAADDPAGAR